MDYSWVVNKEDRLLTFVKERVDAKTKDLRFSIEHHNCRVNGQIERFCSRKLKKDDRVEFSLELRPSFTFEREHVLYEDEHLLVYNKPARISSEELSKRLQLLLVHRLDRDTTGVMLFAKNEKAQKALETLFRRRAVEKTYVALVHGAFPHQKRRLVHKMSIKRRLPGKVIWGVFSEGKSAITDVVRVKTDGTYSLLKLYPKTGRTHQLRVQLSHVGHPIVGDVDYGPKKSVERCIKLHASKIVFPHPCIPNYLVNAEELNIAFALDRVFA